MDYNLKTHFHLKKGKTNGMPIETVSKMLRHKNLQTTQIYSKVIDKKISEDMAILKEKLAG